MRMTLKIPPGSLRALDVGRSGVVTSLDMPGDDRAELDAVGVSPGRSVTVLRRAPFGGPVHVRVDTGVEVALDAELAARIAVSGGAP